MYIYMYIHIYVYMNTCTHTYVYVYMYMYIYMYIYRCTHELGHLDTGQETVKTALEHRKRPVDPTPVLDAN